MLRKHPFWLARIAVNIIQLLFEEFIRIKINAHGIALPDLHTSVSPHVPLIQKAMRFLVFPGSVVFHMQ